MFVQNEDYPWEDQQAKTTTKTLRVPDKDWTVLSFDRNTSSVTLRALPKRRWWERLLALTPKGEPVSHTLVQWKVPDDE